MDLEFDLPAPLSNERVRTLFEAMAGALLGHSVTLERTRHFPLSDPNGGNACFAGEWKAGPVVFTHCVDTMESNPYDGYPYENKVELTLSGRTLRAHHAGSGPEFTSLRIQLLGCTELERNMLRSLVRGTLGANGSSASTTGGRPQ